MTVIFPRLCLRVSNRIWITNLIWSNPRFVARSSASWRPTTARRHRDNPHRSPKFLLTEFLRRNRTITGVPARRRLPMRLSHLARSSEFGLSGARTGSCSGEFSVQTYFFRNIWQSDGLCSIRTEGVVLREMWRFLSLSAPELCFHPAPTRYRSRSALGCCLITASKMSEWSAIIMAAVTALEEVSASSFSRVMRTATIMPLGNVTSNAADTMTVTITMVRASVSALGRAVWASALALAPAGNVL
jgi:hypothetical protein